MMIYLMIILKEMIRKSQAFNYTNINYDDENNTPLMLACDNGQFEILKYLLTSPKLTEHANIHAEDMKIVEFLIMDMNIKIDEETLCYLTNNKSKNECCNRVLTLFKVKELKNNLENNLTFNTNHKLKHKI